MDYSLSCLNWGRQHPAQVTAFPPRGNLYARDGEVIADNLFACLFVLPAT